MKIGKTQKTKWFRKCHKRYKTEEEFKSSIQAKLYERHDARLRETLGEDMVSFLKKHQKSMRLRKIIEYQTKRWYISQKGEKNGIKIGTCIEESDITAEYDSAGKKDQKFLEPYLEGEELVKMKTGRVFTMERKNKRFNLATIYYREDMSTGLLPVVVDIHYHINRSDNGYRTQEQTIKTVNEMLISLGYQKELVMGGFARKKKHKSRNTPNVIHNVKVYTKVE